MATRKKKSAKIYKKVLSIVLIVMGITMLWSVFTKVYTVYSLQQQAALVEKELNLLKDENASLNSTKEKLEDPEYIQTYARGEYMFSKGDEKVFYLPSN